LNLAPPWLVLFSFLGKDLAGEIGRGEERKKRSWLVLFSFPYLSWVIRILFEDQLFSNQLTKPDAD